jgi:hypothetical protein
MPRDDDDRDDRDDDRPRRSRRRERDDREEDDYDDDRPRRRRRRDADPTGGLIPVGNGMSLAAYYCGVFSFIPCAGLVLGPLAVIFGFMGLSRANKYPEVKGKGHSIAGIVCGGLTTLGNVVGIVYLAVMAAAK